MERDYLGELRVEGSVEITDRQRTFKSNTRALSPNLCCRRK